jgi:hypothetical protein
VDACCAQGVPESATHGPSSRVDPPDPLDPDPVDPDPAIWFIRSMRSMQIDGSNGSG